jgi:16S rRNA processing protein RimM
MLDHGLHERVLPDYIHVGQITRPHGLHGDVRVQPMTEDPDRFQVLERIFLSHDDMDRVPFHVTDVKNGHKFVILHLEGIDSIEDAEKWRNAWVQIPRQECPPLPEGRHYYFELVDMTVVTTDGRIVGQVDDIQSYPAHDIFVVRTDDHQYLIPNVPSIVVKIDVENGKMVIDPIDGLLE